MTGHFSNSRDFEEWCEDNGYDADPVSITEEPYKRSVLCYGYILHGESNTYAAVNWRSDYDWGSEDYEITADGLKRVEREVVHTVIDYI